MSWKNIRIGLMLGLMIFAGAYTAYQEKLSRSWDRPLDLVLYPINAEGYEGIDAFIERLTVEDFEEINDFFVKEAANYGINIPRVLSIKLGPKVIYLPPPKDMSNRFKTMMYTLQIRLWSLVRLPTVEKENPIQVRMAILYYSPEFDKVLEHSLGLQKGLLGICNLFASTRQKKQNNIVIAHEFLHTLGATDKYSLTTNFPIFPDGFANPDKKPLYPQYKAELMAGRTPLSKVEARMPNGLEFCMIGDKTAQEINWLQQ